MSTWPSVPEDPEPREPQAGDVRLQIQVRGEVQGVGFRAWTRSQAVELGLSGWASNLPDGRVEVVAEGSEENTQALLELLRGGQTPGRVSEITADTAPARGTESGFTER